MDVTLQNEQPGTQTTATPLSRARRMLKLSGWVGFSLSCLIVFTVLKLPTQKLDQTIQASISAFLAPKGMSLQAAQSGLKMGLGLSYQMTDVTLQLPGDAPPTKIEEIVLKPSLLSLLIGRMGGHLSIQSGKGSMDADGGLSGNSVDADVTFRSLDLGKLGLLPVLAGIRGGAVVSGTAKVKGDIAIPSTLEGKIDLKLSPFVMEAQSIQGFALPKLMISESEISARIERAKVVLGTVRLGKPGNALEDVQATLTGDIALGKQWEASLLDIKARFSFSENVTKSLILLDALLGAGKQADGSYGYSLTGSISAPLPMPLTAQPGSS